MPPLIPRGSFVYFAFGRIVELVMLCFRRRESNEIEIVVLRCATSSTSFVVVSSRGLDSSRRTERGWPC
jgi:hypothetical protein